MMKFPKAITSHPVLVASILLISSVVLALFIMQPWNKNVQFRSKPHAKIKEGEVYRLNLIISLPDISVSGKRAIRQEIAALLGRINAEMPNLVAEAEYCETNKMPELIAKLAGQKDLPDIAYMSPGTMGVYSYRQVPLEGYMKQEAVNALLAAAKAGVSDGEHIFGWPVTLDASVWAVQAATAIRLGLDATTWASGELSAQEIAGKLEKRLPVLACTLPDNLFLGSVFMPSEVPGTALPGKVLQKAEILSGKDIQPLDLFFSERVLSLAPVSHSLREFLVNTYEMDPKQLYLLPTPLLERKNNVQSNTPALVGGYVVFAGDGKEFAGHDHIAAAVTLVRFLAAHSNRFCELCYEVPASRDVAPSPCIEYLAMGADRMMCARIDSVVEGGRLPDALGIDPQQVESYKAELIGGLR